jgi:hypothetical protein
MAINLGGLRQALGEPQPLSALRQGKNIELIGKVMNFPGLVKVGRQLVIANEVSSKPSGFAKGLSLQDLKNITSSLK